MIFGLSDNLIFFEVGESDTLLLFLGGWKGLGGGVTLNFFLGGWVLEIFGEVFLCVCGLKFYCFDDKHSFTHSHNF